MEITTQIDGLVLRSLGEPDLALYEDLVARNRVHLTTHGDYADLVRASTGDLESELREPVAGRFGMWLRDELIGRVDLIPKEGTNAVLGYWLDEDRLGSGFATAACRGLIRYGMERLGVTDVWAGVTHGNERSVAVLKRLGFETVGDMGSYTRFHLTSAEDRPSDAVRALPDEKHEEHDEDADRDEERDGQRPSAQ